MVHNKDLKVVKKYPKKLRLKAKRKNRSVRDNNWEGGTERCDQSVLGFRLIGAICSNFQSGLF